MIILILIVFVIIYIIDKLRIDKSLKENKEQVDKILGVFDNTLSGVLTHLKETDNKFLDVIAKTEIQHFKNLEKQSERQLELLAKHQLQFLQQQTELVEALNPPPKPETLSSLDLDEKIPNDIEKGRPDEFPLGDIPNIPISDNLKVQLDGEEEIYPIDFTNSIMEKGG